MATFDKFQVIEQGSLEDFARWAECYKVYQLPNGSNFIAIRSERNEQAMFGSQAVEEQNWSGREAGTFILIGIAC
jgi:hypothetical protein